MGQVFNAICKILGSALTFFLATLSAGWISRGVFAQQVWYYGGVPVKLSREGEITFFLWGALLSVALLIALRAKFGPAPFERAHGFGGPLIGVAVGTLSGLISYPLFAYFFFTLPDEVFRFLTTA